MPRRSTSFVNLHCHTDYSLLDGMAKVEDYADLAVKYGQPGLGIADHGNAAGILKLVKACKKRGLIPVPGVELYHVKKIGATDPVATKANKRRFHLVVMAVSTKGYQNLMKLVSESWSHDPSEKKWPLVDDEMLARYSEGLVVLTGCLGSRFNQALLNDEEDEAVRMLDWFSDVFGEGNVFIEVQAHDIEDQKRLTPIHQRLSKQTGIPLVATADSHYLYPEDHEVHEALLCMQTGKTLDDPDRFRFEADTNYMPTTEEMYKAFPEDEFPGAVSNTVEIAMRAEGIDYHLNSGYLIPVYPDVESEEDATKLLRSMTRAGLEEKYGAFGKIPDRIIKQADYELGVIEKMHFSSYFLIVQDLVAAARRGGFFVGPGRGSGAGCMVGYALDITRVDPDRYGLFFERFLNPNRQTMPDFDIDVEPAARSYLRRYAAQRYGNDRVLSIGTFGQMKGKSSIKNAARVLGYPFETGARLSALYPPATATGEIPFSMAVGPEPKETDKFYRSWKDAAQLRKTFSSGTDEEQEILQLALSVSGYFGQRGRHAGAVLITPTRYDDYVPCHGPFEDGIGIASYDLHDVEEIGGLKMDLLGLNNLAYIRRALELVESSTGRHIDIDDIPLDDPKVYDMLSRGDTDGVFQFDTPLMTDYLEYLQPKKFEDLYAVLAMIRPGPMGSKSHIKYADRRLGKERVTYDHPDLIPILQESAGLMVFQEQLINLVQVMAGFTAAEADTFRRATGKKDMELLAGEEAKFRRGMKDNGYDDRLIDTLWDLIPPFAEYSFNKCAWVGQCVQVRDPDGRSRSVSIDDLERMFNDPSRTDPVYLDSVWYDGYVRPHKIKRVVRTGKKPLYNVTTASGATACITKDHRMLSSKGYLPLSDLQVGDDLVHTSLLATSDSKMDGYDAREHMAEWLTEQGIAFEARKRLPNGLYCDFYFQGTYWVMDHLDRDPDSIRDYYEASPSPTFPVVVVTPEDYRLVVGLRLGLNVAETKDAIVSIEYWKDAQTADIEMEDDGPRNFVLSSGLVSHNSHAVAYAQVSYQTAWLKANYPAHYIAAGLSVLSDTKWPAQIRYAKSLGIVVNLVDINTSQDLPTVRNDQIYLGLSTVLGPATVANILDVRRREGAFKSLPDFLVKMYESGYSIPSKFVRSLIHSGAFDSLHKSRKSMDDNVERLVEACKQEANVDDDPSAELFSDMGLDSVEKKVDSFDLDGEDYSLSERTVLEVDALGFFAGVHPFATVRTHLESAGNRSKVIPSDARPVSPAVPDGNQKVYGVIASATTFGKRKFLRLRVEDDQENQMDMVIFREGLSMAPGSVIVASGDVRPSGSDDIEKEMVVDKWSVISLDALSDSANEVVFVVRTYDEIESLAEKLRSVGPGRTGVTIVLDGEAVKLPITYSLSKDSARRLAGSLGIDCRTA